MKILQFFLSVTIIFAPLYIIRGYINLPLTNIFLPTTLLEILIAICFISFLFEVRRKEFKFKLLKTKFDLLIFLFLINGLISVFVSGDLIRGFGIYRAYFLEPIIFFYILNYTYIRSKSFNFVVFSFLLSGIWISIMAIVQKLTGSFTLAPHEMLQGRVTAVYNSANSLALYLGPIAVFTIMFFFKSVNYKKILYFIMLGLMLFTIFWTRSRGGLVAVSLSMLIFIYAYLASLNTRLLWFKTKILRKLWYVLLLGIILFVTIFFYQVYKIYSVYPANLIAGEARGDTLHIRFLIWKSTFEMIKESPVLGTGLDGFNERYNQNYKNTYYSEDFQYPHNIFLTFWTETGLIGLLIFSGILLQSYFFLIKNISRYKNNLLAAALLGGFSYSIIHGMVDVPYFKNDLSLLFWIMISLVNYWTVMGNTSPSARS